MADTAAFFASKKKKGTKKKFKAFNANKIDANSVLSSTHVDAPEMSEGVSGLSLGGAKAGDNDDWDESQAVAWGSNAAATNSGADSKVSELLDMQALEVKRNEEDDVAERLRVEETKAQLARAKEGMAKEAERLAAEKAQKEAKAAERAAGGPATGGRWVPAHMRSSGGGVSVGGGGGGGLSSANEELFPDLASADKILADKERQEEEERKRSSSSQPIRAPSGWGSRMTGGSAATAAPTQRKPLNLAPAPAERKPLNLTPAPAAEKAEAVDTKETVVEKTEDKPATETSPPAAAAAVKPAPAAAATPTPAPEKKKVLKKKKKKDLSSFKA
eukprot:CAMPEP_0113408406 /NCGR_PEP_ID=MMETSP0013_2-20120614/20590_1 /TAXON_ID=2843 ORGANISM="Skeletonema costatum, Strain 1716" /NCGR_SAMPLE_ID=MMETSP0013_2 /ASSEMBLY_ACC=CAM_ASM_000158 /LENGTH=330 /DNA_ID=CAMNT_0000294441 /DNA_START=44 /DNA_END=1036 /DNA_ORIENTATION=+ /assembly_acc=CAM_ASM_000158